MRKIKDEDIARAIRELDEAYIRQIEEAEKKNPHTFSQNFARKMHEICPDIDPLTGSVADPRLSASKGQKEKEKEGS